MPGSDSIECKFIKVDFKNFKAFTSFSLEIKHFNILVGPNNAGKSTILAAFRILSSAMRKASAKRAESIPYEGRYVYGYRVDMSAVSVAEENIYHDYDDDNLAQITFSISGGKSLTLIFPEPGNCFMINDTPKGQINKPAEFKKHFPCNIGFVPILGPVEHNELLYDKEAARLALLSYHASRNFRNIWHHYPEKFNAFREMLQLTWPGMDVQRPEVDKTHAKPRLYMYCPEKRFPREIFWAGFGFQVWCQMLTHIIQSSDSSIFLIDEPDIYLHSDLQRQLVNILRDLGPDILIATHSAEMIAEAEIEDIVIVNKDKRKSKRVKNTQEINSVFSLLGSNLNPTLTQVAKTKKVLFLEGKDFKILSKFSRKIGENSVANMKNFAVIRIDGFNVDRIRSIKSGIEATIGSNVSTCAILDRDFRSKIECDIIMKSCGDINKFTHILERKEIENYLLSPSAIDRAIEKKIKDRNSRSDKYLTFHNISESILNDYKNEVHSYCLAQSIDFARKFDLQSHLKGHRSTADMYIIENFDEKWKSDNGISVIPGKDAISKINTASQSKFGVSLMLSSIIESMRSDEIPEEIRILISKLVSFSERDDGSPD